MSDPVTNMQIEDVLSSIRKLVSEEVRAQTRPRGGAGEAPARTGKLILTAAQRVPEEETAEDSIDTEYGGAAAASDFDMDAFSRDLMTESGDEFEFGSEADEADPVEPLFVHDRRAARAAVAGQSLKSLAEAGFEDEGANAGTPLDISAYAEAAEDEAAAEDDHDDLIDEAPEAAPIPSFLRSRGVGSLSERLSAVRPEPEEDALSWEDHEDEAGLPEPVPEELDAEVWAEAGALDEAPGQGMMIDEEVLRDMVSEIVRQELQGALGERITRNVRKLVRREIQRALTAHDLL